MRSLREVLSFDESQSTNFSAGRWTLEIRHTRAQVPLFPTQPKTLHSICHAETGNRNLLTYNSLDRSGGSVFRINPGTAKVV